MDDRTRAERVGEPVVTAAPAEERDTRSAGSLITDALTHMSTLVRKEFDLARAEMSENLTRAAVAVGLLVGALVFALTALNVLAAALVAALTEMGIRGGWSALIVGVVFAVIAGIMAAKGANDLRGTSLAPTRTAENLRKDREAVKESL